MQFTSISEDWIYIRMESEIDLSTKKGEEPIETLPPELTIFWNFVKAPL